MTSLPARPQYKERRENTSSTSFVFTDCFIWSVHSGKSTVLSIMARTSRAFKKCVDPCPRYLTHTNFASFVWAMSRHAMSSRGQSAYTVSCERRRMWSWGSHLNLADELERELSFRARRPRTKRWIVMMRSFWHHPIQRLVLCWVMPRKSKRCLRARKLRLNPLSPPALCMTS